MRHLLIVFWMLLGLMTSAVAQVSIGIGMPGLSIGINLPVFPDLVRVPGYPVYYAPQLDANYFFYDGRYWVYVGDNWYASSWYNGPWSLISPDSVPLFILRIPVRYYRLPPPYFHNWHSDAPPRWGEHWGRDWDQRRSGWDRWDRRAVPAPAPLPTYQRRYYGDRYPHAEQQPSLQSQHYRYRPRDPAMRQPGRESDGSRGPAPTPYTPHGDASSQDARPSTRPAPQRAPAPVPAPVQPRGDAPNHDARPPARPAQPRGPAPTPYVPQGDASSQPPVQPAQPGGVRERERGEQRGRDKGQDRGEDRGDGRGR
ncbi:MAG: hypothetical protein RLZ81_2080 [Pseudomonadota bacterium]